MAKIPVDGLIAQFQRMYTGHWSYAWGAATEGSVDCSGAFVYAYRQYNKSIAHGSNAIARKYVVELLPMSKAKPGMAAFKFREPGDKNYSLPQKYRKGGSEYTGDLNDYYHIGLVDQDTGYILNAQSTATGFVRSRASQGWACCGYLKAVDYKEGDDPMQDDPSTNPGQDTADTTPVVPGQSAVVTANSGKTVNVRTRPNGAKQDKVPIGSVVTVMEVNGEWARVDYHQQGYMMTRFLTDAGEGVG